MFWPFSYMCSLDHEVIQGLGLKVAKWAWYDGKEEWWNGIGQTNSLQNMGNLKAWHHVGWSLLWKIRWLNH